MIAQDRPSVFDGLRVLDLSRRLAAAWCGRLFADWGADVLLAEPPEGHPLRAEPPFLDDLPGAERSLLHAYANSNKRAAVLRPDDRAGLDALIAWADVVITSDVASPHPALSAPDARQIHVSVTPYGLDGPLAGLPGNDLTAYARSSWAASSGDPGEPPLKGSANQAGYFAGLLAFVGAAAAVFHRGRTGAGQRVEVSELEALTLIAGPAILVAEHAGAVAPRHAPDMVRGPVACRDGYFSLTISRAQFWRDAMNVLGLADLAEDERYAQGWFRRVQREHYADRVQAAIRQWPRWELFEELAAMRCIAGIVLETREVVENPHLAARGFFAESTVADERPVAFPGAPVKLSATPWALRGPAPALSSNGQSAIGNRDSEASRSSRLPIAHCPAPLSGIRAVVLTQAWSGTFATELLGLLGADVIQVEGRSRPDSWRGDYSGAVPAAIADPAKRQRAWNTSGLYNAVNLNKRAITLDLADERGRDLFRRLAAHADIVAENFTPRVLGNLGLGYDDLRRIKPDIILASLSAYGASGPYANIPGIGGTIEPMSGMSSLLGYAGGRPQNSGSMYPDPVAGSYCAAAMIMALYHRERTGEGQFVELGMMEANATFIGDALLEWSANGTVRGPRGNRHPRLAPHGIYRCRNDEREAMNDELETEDGHRCEPWLALACEDEAQWAALVGVIGRPGLLDDARFATMATRKAHEDALDAIIEEWAATQEAEPAAARLLAAGVTAAPVRDTRTVLDDEQLRARGFFVEVAHPEAGRHPQAGVPWRFSRTPVAVGRPAPMLGEHSREVFAELLGMTDGEYEELVQGGITGDMPPE